MPPTWLIRSIVSLQALRCDLFCHQPIVLQRSIRHSSVLRQEVTPLRKQLKDSEKRARAQSHIQPRNASIQDIALDQWELTVGIEIHAQLNTIRKLFSRARHKVDSEANTGLAQFDLATPGSQPLLQLSTLIPALRAAIALGCHIEPVSRFDRKHYFYHDQPSGYQITQYYQPLARNGSILLSSEDGLHSSDGRDLVVGIKQIQLEQDTAKTQELEDGVSSIDFTRSGQPLIEIISLPHIHSPEAAAAYIRKIQSILFAVDSVTTGMELGGLRADVNVSVRRVEGPPGNHSYSGVTGLGQRTEIKNLSSFKAVEDAIKAERDRQIAVIEAGGRVEGETRGWSQTKPNETRRLRGKEGEVDYRYMPDPDIAPLYIGPDLIAEIRRSLPPVPEQLIALLVERYGFSTVDAKALLALQDGRRLIYYQEVAELIPALSDVEKVQHSKVAGNWVLHELGALLTMFEIEWTPDLVPAPSLARIIELQLTGKITGTSGKQLLRKVVEGERMAVDDIITREKMWFDSMNEDELRALALQIIEEHAETTASIKKGNHKKIGFFVGLLLKTGGRNRIDARQAELTFKSLLLD